MSADIITNLRLDKEFETSRVIVAQEINGCDSSFIVSCMLGHCIKKNKPVLVVSTHNSFLHYQNAGLKMNYNLQRYVDNGLIVFYNLGNEVVDNFMANQNISLQKLVSTFQEKVKILKDKYASANVIFDGVTHLFDLQFTIGEINSLCKNIIDAIRLCDNSFVFFHCNVVNEDDVSHVMANLLAHKAYTIVEVGSLSSGLSADVSGHLIIRHPGQKFEQEYIYSMETKPTKYLFKLFDRGVKLFAPGTV